MGGRRGGHAREDDARPDVEYDVGYTNPDGRHVEVWIEGVTPEYGAIANVMFRPGARSFYEPDSLPPPVRDFAVKDVDEFLLKRARALAAHVPVRALELVTNERRAAGFLEDRLRTLGIPAYVRIERCTGTRLLVACGGSFRLDVPALRASAAARWPGCEYVRVHPSEGRRAAGELYVREGGRTWSEVRLYPDGEGVGLDSATPEAAADVLSWLAAAPGFPADGSVVVAHWQDDVYPLRPGSTPAEVLADFGFD